MAEKSGAGKMSKSLAFAAKLFEDGKITEHECDVLQSFLAFDIAADARDSSAENNDRYSVPLPGNVMIKRVRPEEPVWMVFNTAELLENILGYVTTNDVIFSIPFVCKGFRAATRESSKLLKLAYLKPDWHAAECFFDIRRLPGWKSVPGINIDIYHSRIHVWPARISQSTGARATYRSVLLCQPPITQAVLKAYLSCDYEGEMDFIDDSNPFTVQNTEGITFGQIMDLAPYDLAGPGKWCPGCRFELSIELDDEEVEPGQTCWTKAWDDFRRLRLAWHPGTDPSEAEAICDDAFPTQPEHTESA